jgi:putative ABC transport system permease protein
MNLLAVAFRNVGRNRRRSILSAVSIALATSVTVFMFALIEGLKKDMVWNTFTMETGQVRVRTEEFDENEKLNPLHLAVPEASAVIDVIRGLPEVKDLVPRIPFPTLLYKGGKTYKARGIGVDVLREESFQGISKMLIEGRMPDMGTRETAIAVGLSREMGLGLGDKFTVWTGTATQGTNAMTFKIVGILRFSVASYNRYMFFAPLDTVQRLLGMQGSATEILVILRNGEVESKAVAGIAGSLREAGMTRLTVKPWSEVGIWYTYLKLADSIYAIFALAFVLLASTVVINTTMMTVYERTREIGTMSALGMKGGRIVFLFFLESLFIGLAGSISGTLLGIGITLPMSVYGLDYTEMMKNIDIGMSTVYYPILNVRSIVLSFLYSAAVAALVSILPSRRASRVEPVKALRAI